MIFEQNVLDLQNIVMVERDYKGQYERGIMSLADFKESFPSADTTDMSGQSETLRPMVHIWYSRPENESELQTFLTDMEDGLPQGDIDSGNTAYLRKDLFSEEYAWMFPDQQYKWSDRDEE